VHCRREAGCHSRSESSQHASRHRLSGDSSGDSRRERDPSGQ